MKAQTKQPASPQPCCATAKQASSSHGQKKRVLLVDDHPMMRQGLVQIINQQKDITVCCEAGDARDAMQRITSSKPDLAVVDISLEGKSGLELIKDAQALQPELPILVMSMHDESLYAERVLRAGARGYVMKTAGGEAILQAIRQVLNGKIYVSPRMSAQILSNFAAGSAARHRSPIEILTDREFEVFHLIGEGCTTREVASRLTISTKTVEVYRQHLKEKLHLPNATSLIQHAVRWVETKDRT
jgi:DNA-binding NarL/FixJ family response regulator